MRLAFNIRVQECCGSTGDQNAGETNADCQVLERGADHDTHAGSRIADAHGIMPVSEGHNMRSDGASCEVILAQRAPYLHP